MAFACALIGLKTPPPPARNRTHYGDTPPPPGCVRTLCIAPYMPKFSKLTYLSLVTVESVLRSPMRCCSSKGRCEATQYESSVGSSGTDQSNQDIIDMTIEIKSKSTVKFRP